ncbi:signal recognition particle-docking protein FtsY [Spirochaetia bacterium]|nr:signal recognition particle-docking protein FtsY [Spirochaetia bacterium]
MGIAAFAGRLKQLFGKRDPVSDALFDDLSDLLVEGDFGASEAFETVEELKKSCKKDKITDADAVRQRLAQILETKLLGASLPATGFKDLESAGKTSVILLLGVNGVGKTTSAAKFAARYRDLYHRRPILAAADTFRAAAIDQIKIHGERLGIRVVAHKHGGDPAAVVYDALEAALSGGGDLIIADTAGRMHTKTALVEELKKIDRVIEAKASDCVIYKWLVLDATTGRNAVAQAEIFHEAVKLDGVVLTKYDSSARGGVVFSLADTLHLPVLFLCSGEKYGDIAPFDPVSYVREFTGLE